MTSDFIDDLALACEKEGCPYILIVQTPDGKAVNVRDDLEGWKTCRVDRSKKEDILQLLDVTIFA